MCPIRALEGAAQVPSGGGGNTPGAGSPGSPCTTNADCMGGANAECIPEADGWPGGYCIIKGCEAGDCPAGSECFQTTDGSTLCLDECTSTSDCAAGYGCLDVGACIPACTPGSCDPGEVCGSEGICEAAPCMPGSCPGGLVCDTASGLCIADVNGGPGPGPGPDCQALPERDCQGTAAHCGELLPFEPVTGPGYDNYPLNGETATNQYRSFARRDMVLLVKWAAAYVACKADGWSTGHGGPLGLGDMSEANGAIPGTSDGDPGHPPGTHIDGYDMDAAYFQVGTADNKLRAVLRALLQRSGPVSLRRAPGAARRVAHVALPRRALHQPDGARHRRRRQDRSSHRADDARSVQGRLARAERV